MTTETTISDAISQLEMLGIDRKKAINALSRYNYNVERAADFIFSGGADTEESFFLNETEFTRNNNEDFLWSQATPFDKISTTTTTEQPSQIQQHISINDHSTVTSHTEAEEEGEEEEDMEQEQKRAVLIKDYQNQGKSSDVTRDNASWSVVPFTANEYTQSSSVSPNTNTKSLPHFTQSSLTWWRDPDAPSDRAAIDNIPIGLRPPSYHFAYAPIIIQALFHITLFRSAILSYRPTPQTWGNSTNYWKGFGEPVHGYIVKPPPQQQRQQQSSQLTSDDTIMTIDKDESISLTPNIMDSSINNNVNGPTTDIWDSIPDRKEFQPDEPKPMTTMTEPSDTSILRMDELVSMTKDQIALAELQKLFAFLGNTKRLYGSIAHFVRAINTRVVTSSTEWQADDKTVEDFLDSVIGGLISIDETNRIDESKELIKTMDFKNLFLISAQVSNGAETDYEDIYYLNLGMNTSMRSFHDCLDPLVYESYQVDSEIAIDSSDVDNDDEDLGSNESDEEDMRGSYKFTTFTQVPPILFVTLEDRQDYQEQQKSKKEGSSYKLEKTIYLDRYLIENKDLALQKYQLAAQWKSDIRRTQKEIWNLQHEGLPQSISTSVDDANYLKDDTPVTLGKCQLLNTTAEYLNSQVSSLAATDENIEYIKSLQSIQQVLYHVRDDIEKKQKELKQLELERQESLKNLFDDPRLRKVPYDLRAVLHTDGLSGTGHYWGYIWVEPSEINLLEDIPVEGSGWYRFCDAMVEKVTEEDVWDERTDPFALVYADRSIQRFSKQQLDQVTPEDLLQFIQDDNAAFANEGLEDDGQNSIYNINIDNSGSNSSQHSSMQRSNSQISIGTDHYSLEFGNDENSEDQTPNYCQQGFTSGNRSPARSKESNLSSNKTQQIRDNHPTLLSTMKSSRLVDLAVANIIEMRTSIEGDYRFLKRFDLFLARAGDMEILARFYQLVNQVFQNNNIDGSNNPKVENNSEVGVKDSEISVEYFNNELDLLSMAEIRDIIRSDSTLVLMFEQYESYLSIGHRIASALTMFVYDNYNASLEHILEYYKEQSNWGIILASSNELLWKFPGLNDLSFRAIASKFGKACLKKLNDDAHTKACNLAYRNRGLQDGIRIAYQAIKFVNDDNHDNNNNVQFLSELGERWFDYAEGQSGTLTDDQAQLLNNLVMLYLDAASSIMLPENDQVTNNTDKLSLATSTDDSPIWLVFRKSLHDAEAKLLKTL